MKINLKEIKAILLALERSISNKDNKSANKLT
jgi:hypothetical protein